MQSFVADPAVFHITIEYHLKELKEKKNVSFVRNHFMHEIALLRYIVLENVGMITKIILLRVKVFQKVGTVIKEFVDILNKNMVIIV